jgi:hypothetical protein
VLLSAGYSHPLIFKLSLCLFWKIVFLFHGLHCPELETLFAVYLNVLRKKEYDIDDDGDVEEGFISFYLQLFISVSSSYNYYNYGVRDVVTREITKRKSVKKRKKAGFLLISFYFLCH